MNRQAIYNKIKAEAIRVAEEDLRTIRWSEIYGTGGTKSTTDSQVLNLDWHPYYMRITQTDGGLKFQMVVRDGEIEYFRKHKKGMPDFETPARHGMQAALKKHYPELVMLELLDNFNTTKGVTAEWQ